MQEQFYVSILNDIVNALIERGHNPYGQLKGYVLEQKDIYITSHCNARKIIKSLAIEDIEKYLLNWENYQDKKWQIDFMNMKQAK